MRHTLAVLVNNSPGVLARVAGLFSRRGFNIESIAVGETEEHSVSRMTIVVTADDVLLEQVTKQLYKLIDVIKISDLTNDPAVEREMALIKVTTTSANRSEILQIVDIFRAKIVDVSEKAVIIEVTGGVEKIEAIMSLLRNYGIKEVARTGKVAMARSVKG